MSQRRVPSCILKRPVASRPVHRHEGGEDADQEQDKHHVLSEPNVLLLHPGRPSAPEEIFLGVKLPATESSACPRLLQGLDVILIDHPGVDTKLKLSSFIIRNTRMTERP